MTEQMEPEAHNILIFTTPKTGNIWLKALLADIYGVNAIDSVSPVFQPAQCEGFGDRWVYHAHPFPEEDVLRWAETRGFLIVTMYRHPGDILVSYLHHVWNRPSEARWPANLILQDKGRIGPNTLTYVVEHFPHLLTISLGWRRFGAPFVRYEDLYSRPMDALTELTNEIAPVDPQRIRVAVAMSEMNYLRDAVPHDSKVHFRHGEVGEWQEVLPREIIEVFREYEPYPTLFRAMGYSLESQPDIAHFPYGSINPLRGKLQFDNGVSLSPVIVRAYLDRLPSSAERWPKPESVEEGSFYQWLNSWCPSEGATGGGSLPVTNLAQIIYEYRKDLRQFAPEHRGRDWPRFCQWFITQARIELGLDFRFLQPMVLALANWASGLG